MNKMVQKNTNILMNKSPLTLKINKMHPKIKQIIFLSSTVTSFKKEYPILEEKFFKQFKRHLEDFLFK